MLIDNLGKGGKERRLLELLKYLDRIVGYEIFLVVFRNCIEYTSVFDLKNTKVKVLKRRIKKDPLVFFTLRNIIKEFCPNIVHSWGSMPSIYVAITCFLYKIPLLNAMVADCYFPFWGESWLRSQITYPFSKRVLSNSYNGSIAYKVPYKKASVIRNGVHLSRFVVPVDPGEIKRKFNIKTSYVIGMVAAFHPRKDYETYIKVAINIIFENEDVTFLAIGDGPLLTKMKSLVPDEISERLLFLGKQSKVEEIISILDIGVLTALYEGISNSIMEYMALGKPVIAYNGGGNVELVDNGITGYVITPYNENELRDKITYLLSHPDVCQLFGENGRRKIELGFDIEKRGQEYIELYKDLCIR